MENKLQYEAPDIQVVDIRFEGIICQSQEFIDDRDNYDITPYNPFDI